MTAAFSYFYRVDLTVATYSGGSTSTKTYSFVNKTLSDSTSLTTYWPILQSVGELSFQAGEIMPVQSFGSVTIDNRRGSFGGNRKFSDVLQRYSPIEQEVVFYVAQVSNLSDTVSSWTQLGKAKVSSWEVSAAGEDPSLTFEITPLRIDDKIVTLEVARTVSGMENAPESSLGRPVPLALGTNKNILPIRISADGATTGKYAISTCMYQHLKVDLDDANVYCKGPEDKWHHAFGSANFITSYSTAGYHSLESSSTAAVAYWIGTASNYQGPLVTGVEFKARAGGGASSNCLLNVILLRFDPTTHAVIEEEKVGTVALNQYDATNDDLGNTEFSIKVSFDRPRMLSGGSSFNYFAIGLSATGWQLGDMEIHLAQTVGSIDKFTKSQDGAGTSADASTEWAYSTSTTPWKMKLLTASFAFDDHVDAYTQSGLTYASLTVSQEAPDSGQSAPSFDTISFLVAGMDGLQDYNSPFTVFNEPHNLVEKLAYTWNGSAWVDSSTWDTTTLDSTHYQPLYDTASTNIRARRVSGYIDTRSTFSQLIAEIARGTASRIGILSGGKSFLYPWGAAASSAADVPACDIIGLSWQQRDISTIVNRAVISFSRDPLYAPRDSDISGTDTAGYAITTDYSAVNYAQVASITAESRAVYGNRELAEGKFNLYSVGGSLYLSDESAGNDVLGEYYLARYAKPLVYASFVVPWHRYSSLKMFDVINFQHPDFPAYYGTDPEPPMPVVDTGSTVERVDPNAGYEWVQAEPYRGLIEGISYVMAMEHAPAIRLTVLVLLNQPWDPT